jgi:hypothetical protein
MRKYGSINLIVTISMVIAIVLFLPGLGLAGSLEPSGPPAPTMRTLDEIYSTNSWSKGLKSLLILTVRQSSTRRLVLSGRSRRARAPITGSPLVFTVRICSLAVVEAGGCLHCKSWKV